jgi:hypothetical protein
MIDFQFILKKVLLKTMPNCFRGNKVAHRYKGQILESQIGLFDKKISTF